MTSGSLRVRAGVAAALLALLPQSRSEAQGMRAELAQRRAAVARGIGNGTLVVTAAGESSISRLGYVPDQNYLYLTGLREAGGALLLTIRGGVGEARLFVADKEPAAEVWTGTRLGTEAAQSLTGIPTSSRSALAAALKTALVGDTLLVANDTSSASPMGQLLRELRSQGAGPQVRSAAAQIRRVRMIKSDAELALIRKAAELTLVGFDAAVAAIAPGRHEYQVEAALTGAYRAAGADGDAFPPIVASGDNATTLHYESNDAALPSAGMVLMDVGASYHDYASDFTRTIPVSGRFTADQRTFYQIVLDAQLRAESIARARVPFPVVSDTGRRTLAAGLARLGLIESPEATYDLPAGENCPRAPDGACYQWFLYYMHSVGHGVGLDVHDPLSPALEPGSVFMIEMGAYVRRRMETLIPATPRNAAFLSRTAAARTRFAGFGVRLEDEYFATRDGVVLVTPWPRAIAEVEARALRLRSTPPRLDATLPSRYPRARALR
jgi:Xaa-Pro aminopeptidase